MLSQAISTSSDARADNWLQVAQVSFKKISYLEFEQMDSASVSIDSERLEADETTRDGESRGLSESNPSQIRVSRWLEQKSLCWSRTNNTSSEN